MRERDEWTVGCRDMHGRRRRLTVFASGGRVVVIGPPGEAAVLSPLEAGRLRAALRDVALADTPAPAVGRHGR